MVPSLSATNRRALARPNPVPRKGPFVVKRGSKHRARVSSSMPTPVSASEMTT